MAKNLIFDPADRLSVVVTNPTTPASGDPIRYGSCTGIALENEVTASGETVCHLGKFVADLSVKGVDGGGNSAVNVGDSIFYVDGDTPKLSKKSSGYFFGFAMESITSGSTATIRVLHVPSPGSGALGAGTVGEANLAAGAVTGAKLADSANNRVAQVFLGAVSATTSFIAFIAPVACTLVSVQLATKDAIAANDTNYWTITLYDKGSGGAGTDKIGEKTTMLTGGTGFAAYDMWDIGALSGTHKILAAGDVCLLTLTKAASATAFAEALAVISYQIN